MMTNSSISVWAAFAAVFFVCLQRPEFAASQQQQGDQTEAPSDTENHWRKEKRKMLDWLDRYQAVQVIFTEEHIQKLRANVAEMSKDELYQWLAQTAEVRAVLDSDEWKETREWYREFLRVQAIYNDEDIERSREKAANASPKELCEILLDIKRRRESLRWMHAASEARRQSSLAIWDTRGQQATAVRDANRKAGYHVGQPAFGHEKATGEQSIRESRYHIPPPIITSREVARGAVWSSIFGGCGWGW
ncbi:MAG: hypothetical protein ISR77_38955 [Pirellulaceae bacterium]|nr:hypothetical protein [Pirellulaceae bacterium]